jgi:hypothetical protein
VRSAIRAHKKRPTGRPKRCIDRTPTSSSPFHFEPYMIISGERESKQGEITTRSTTSSFLFRSLYAAANAASTSSSSSPPFSLSGLAPPLAGAVFRPPGPNFFDTGPLCIIDEGATAARNVMDLCACFGGAGKEPGRTRPGGWSNEQSALADARNDTMSYQQ